MFIACTEKCVHQKDGICTKNDCTSQKKYISGAVSCPHFEPTQEDLKDQKRFSRV
jgi:hypothetical protein